MSTCLITGVAGFLGSRFAQWILDNHPECHVLGIDDLSCGYRENVPDGVEFYKIDLSQRNSLAGFGEVEYLYHFAAYAAECLSPFIRTYNYTNNLIATANVINFCLGGSKNHSRGPERLVFTSSMSVYGNHPWTPFSEMDKCEPIDPYGIAKRACELDIMSAAAQHRLKYSIIRPHNLYGPGQSIWQKYRNVIGHWMSRALQGQPLLVYGDGMQRRAFSWVDDCLPCLWAAAVEPKAEGQIINLGGAKATTVLEAAHIVSRITGAPIEHREPRHEVPDAWCTTEKSERLLNYKETVSLEQGIATMWEWAKEAWERYPERRDTHHVTDLEVTRGLYSYWRDEPTPQVDAPEPLPSSPASHQADTHTHSLSSS